MQIIGIKHWAFNMYHNRLKNAIRKHRDENRNMRKRISCAIPKSWRDVDDIYSQVCFAIIVEFYENEFMPDVDNGWTDWEKTIENISNHHFVDWLKFSYRAITEDIPRGEEAMEQLYEQWPKESFEGDAEELKSYLCTEIARYEEELQRVYDDILYGLVKYRGQMWT